MKGIFLHETLPLGIGLSGHSETIDSQLESEMRVGHCSVLLLSALILLPFLLLCTSTRRGWDWWCQFVPHLNPLPWPSLSAQINSDLHQLHHWHGPELTHSGCSYPGERGPLTPMIPPAVKNPQWDTVVASLVHLHQHIAV